MRARARSKAMWLNSVLQGRFEVAGWGGCGGCGDGWASLMKVQAATIESLKSTLRTYPLKTVY